MKTRSICIGAALALTASVPAFAAVDEVKASSFGFNPSNATAIIQKALDSGAKRIVIDRQASPWIVEPLFVRSNCEIVFERGVDVTALKGAFRGKTDSLFTFSRVENVKMSGYGAVLRMHRMDYDNAPYLKGEWRMSLNMLSCRNVTVEGLTLLESGGDGVYLGVARGGGREPCRDIVLRDLMIDRQYRQGISVISARNLLIERCVMRNTWGTPPAAGIDFEPNHESEELAGIVMRDCDFIDNQGVGVDFYVGHLDETSAPISIRLENCRTHGNLAGLKYGNGRGTTLPKGRVEVVGCTFANARGVAASFMRKPATSTLFEFTDCRFLDCHASTQVADSTPDFTLASRFPGDPPTDGITFRNCILRQPVAREWMSRKVQAFAPSQPRAISGDITVITPAWTNRIELGAAWCARHFDRPTFNGAPACLAFDPAAARPVDAKPGEMVRLSPLFFRSEVTYRFFAAAPGEVRFRARFRKVGKGDLKPCPLIVSDAKGGMKDMKVKMKVDADPRRNGDPRRSVAGMVSFSVPATGFYTLKAAMTHNQALCLLEASVPVAVAPPEHGPRTVYASQGSFYFRDPGDDGFVVGVAGEGAEVVGAQLADADGRAVWTVPCASDWEVRKQGPAGKGGLWRITFNKVVGRSFEDYSFILLGAGPDLFLSPERHW